MPRRMRSDAVLIVDDEPEYLGWVMDYLESKGLNWVVARTLPEAYLAVDKTQFRLLLVDMNVPAGSALEPDLVRRVPLVSKYPGLGFAIDARNRGYIAPAVVAYTVHDDDAVDHELAKVNCRYVLKGRPQVLKGVIEASLTARSLNSSPGTR